MLLTPRPGRLPTRMLFFWSEFPPGDDAEVEGALVSLVEPGVRQKRKTFKRSSTSLQVNLILFSARDGTTVFGRQYVK